ncbi:MAG: DUF721 domain-containing protein [Deltaproteobacteria bacterium]
MADSPDDRSIPPKRKGRRRPARVSRIASVITSFSNLGIPARIREYTVKKIWAGCVGDSISKKTSPTRLIGQTLYCSAASAAWLTELNYQKKDIIDKINAAIGEDAVAQIIFRIGTIEPPQKKNIATGPSRTLTDEEKKFIEETAEPVTDDDLKALIKRAFEKSKTW